MWQESANKLTKTFKFRDFSQAFSWMTQGAIAAEKLNHHPTWTNTWNTVEVTLTTHDAGDTITDKDRQLAKTFDALYEQYNV